MCEDARRCLKWLPRPILSSLSAPDEFSRIDAWRRATNHAAVGQIYLLENPLLGEPGHIKPRNRD